jgi:O-antigen ligase
MNGLSGAAQLLLLLLIPASVIWWPLATIPGFGMVTVSDALLIALWGITALSVGSRVRHDWQVRAAFAIALLPIVIGALAGLAAWNSSGRFSDATLELSLHLKKYGLAAILPLTFAALPLRRFALLARFVVPATLVASTLAALFPTIGDSLPLAARQQHEETAYEAGRSGGFGGNPNDFAYLSIGLAVLYFALAPRRRGPLTVAMGMVVLAAASYDVVVSASRSGMVAGGVAILLVLLRWRGAPGLRVAAAVALAIAVAMGFKYSDAFTARTVRFFRQGVAEESIAARLATQRSAVATALDHPLGVGSRYTERPMQPHLHGYGAYLGTTDSLYLDTLLASGFLGLAALLAMLRRGWALIGGCPNDHRRAFLQAGFLAFLTAGLATVSPASFFVAPTFFLVVAVSSLDRASPKPIDA